MTHPDRLKLIQLVGTCVTDYGPPGPKTYAEFQRRGEDRCPYYGACSTPGFLDRMTGHQCAMRYGLEAAAIALRDGKTVDSVMHSFRFQHPNPPKGFIWSPDRKRFRVITGFDEAAEKVEEYARMILQDGATVVAAPLSPELQAASPLLSDEELLRRNGGGFRYL